MKQDIIVNERVDTDLTTHDFYYDLPEELIAQTPMEKRDTSRLLVLDRESGALSHKHFYDICDYIRPEDILVVNSSRVIPARLLGENASGSPIELLLLRMHENGLWETLVRPGKRAHAGATFRFGGILDAEITEVLEDGNRLVRFTYPAAPCYEGGFFIGVLHEKRTDDNRICGIRGFSK